MRCIQLPCLIRLHCLKVKRILLGKISVSHTLFSIGEADEHAKKIK